MGIEDISSALSLDTSAFTGAMQNAILNIGALEAGFDNINSVLSEFEAVSAETGIAVSTLSGMTRAQTEELRNASREWDLFSRSAKQASAEGFAPVAKEVNDITRDIKELGVGGALRNVAAGLASFLPESAPLRRLIGDVEGSDRSRDVSDDLAFSRMQLRERLLRQTVERRNEGLDVLQQRRREDFDVFRTRQGRQAVQFDEREQRERQDFLRRQRQESENFGLLLPLDVRQRQERVRFNVGQQQDQLLFDQRQSRQAQEFRERQDRQLADSITKLDETMNRVVDIIESTPANQLTQLSFLNDIK